MQTDLANVWVLSAHPMNSQIERHKGGLVDYWARQCESALAQHPDLIVLPELSNFITCHDMAREISTCDSTDADLLSFFSEAAKAHRCWIVLPTCRRDDSGAIKNSMRVIDRNGQIAGIYDKTYPTIPELEAGIRPGDGPKIIDTEFGPAACVICFDLNFVELRQHYAAQCPRLIFFSSMYHGGHVQNTWAYECRAYFISSVAGLPSTILSPVGELLAATTNYTSAISHAINTDYCVVHLDGHVEKLSALKRKYGFQVNIDEPGLLGSVLITSQSDQYTASQLADEFQLAVLDEYLKRSKLRAQNALKESS